jgi:hypothetical protein
MDFLEEKKTYIYMYNISKKRTKQIFHNILVIMFMTQGVLKILILYTLPFYFINFLYIYIYIYIVGMATSTRLTRYSLEHPIIEYQNRYSVTRKTFFYENNDKIFRTINN